MCSPHPVVHTAASYFSGWSAVNEIVGCSTSFGAPTAAVQDVDLDGWAATRLRIATSLVSGEISDKIGVGRIGRLENVA